MSACGKRMRGCFRPGPYNTVELDINNEQRQIGKFTSFRTVRVVYLKIVVHCVQLSEFSLHLLERS
eukprot:m.183774 g.183774  ORF g.183774 m.183774 type:complete len:66 (+) comp32168_c0_seq1:274-471(+)